MRGRGLHYVVNIYLQSLYILQGKCPPPGFIIYFYILSKKPSSFCVAVPSLGRPATALQTIFYLRIPKKYLDKPHFEYQISTNYFKNRNIMLSLLSQEASCLFFEELNSLIVITIQIHVDCKNNRPNLCLFVSITIAFGFKFA